MSKPALGRGLGNLMHGTKVAGARTDSPDASTGPEEVSVDPGLGSLLRGGKSNEVPPAETTDAAANLVPAHARQTRLIQCSLIGADVLLIGLAGLIVFKRTAPLGAGEVLLCFAAVALGAWLSCLAVMLGSRSE